MRMRAKRNNRLALLIAIFLSVFSTGVAIAHQCHAMSNDQVSTQQQHSAGGLMANQAAKSSVDASDKRLLMDSGCVALFIVVLLLGRKVLNFLIFRFYSISFKKFKLEVLLSHRPQVFHHALSLPQLGVIRI
jgi:hypothetical protein